MKDFIPNLTTVVDFGCGNGEFVDFIERSGIDEVVGVDKNTKVQLSDIQSSSVDAINLVEVIEHLHDNIHPIFNEFHRILKPNGIIYIESTFTDTIQDPLTHSYVDPYIDHSCILSYTALRMIAKEFGVVQLNSHSFILQKL
jgi:2-polyprenyl-3-methyl-5-hydroxy-6-metoxy-1,4-benzoquinol methylase